jgi:hypothetical protein
VRQELPDGGLIDINPQVLDDPVEQLVREIEAHAEANWGWDSKPMYIAFFRTPHMFEACDMRWLPDELFENPGMYLPPFVQWIDEVMERGHSPMLKERFAQVLRPDFLGVALVFEGWAVLGKAGDDGESGEEALRRKLGPLRPSQHPDRKEMRGVTALTVEGDLLMLQRIRGEFPELLRARIDDGNQSGRIPESLAKLVTQLKHLVEA